MSGFDRTGESPGFSEPESARPGEALAARRRRLRFRSWHRGTREADLLLGSFADRHLATMDRERLDQYEALLARSDPDIYAWMTGREGPPAELEGPVMAMLRTHRFAGP